jgi:hypothetical protein
MISPSTILSFGSILGLWVDVEEHFTVHDIYNQHQYHHNPYIFHHAQLNLGSNQALICSGGQSMYSENVVRC